MEKFNKLLIILILSAMFPVFAHADEMANKYFTSPSPKLTADEKAALQIVSDWDEGKKYGVKPSAGDNGAVIFLYGSQRPSIVCAPLQACDVALQPGEKVQSIHVGDNVRWSIESAISGNGFQETEHLIIQPKDVGIETSLVITTDRRTYHLKLKAHRTKYMPNVAFSYPEDFKRQREARKRRTDQEISRNTIEKTGEYLGDLDFNYKITGNGLKPLRVYNDTRKTIIQMPHAMKQTEAPALLVIRQSGQSSEEVIVNYRIQDDRYIVDSVFDKAIMVAGVGRSQNRVEISRRK